MSDPTNDLEAWLQTRFGQLYTSLPTSVDEDGRALFNSVFAPNADIILNHEKTTTDTLRENIFAGKAAMTSATVAWKDIIEVPDSGSDNSNPTGIVAGFFVVTRSLKFRIRAGPAQNNNYNSFSAKIEKVPGNSDADTRRITQLFLTSLSKAAPINLQGAPGPMASNTISPADLQRKIV